MKKIAAIVVPLLLMLGVVAGCSTEVADMDSTQSTASLQYTETTTTKTLLEATTITTTTMLETTTHVHIFENQTCLTPATCACGISDGEAAGHSWLDATCSNPKTCGVCGEEQGEANGHSWKDATCTEAKTCVVCGTSTGLTAGHEFSGGSCVMCGKDDPDYIRETMVWIPTNGGTKYHTHSGCSNMKNPERVTKSEAESLGFTPCKRCH